VSLWNVYLLIIRCLDILISSDLLWANPINCKDVTSKVRKQIGLLYRHFFTSEHCSIWNVVYQRGIHISAKILTCWSQRFATKICTKSWNALHYQDRLETLYLDTLHKRRAYPKQCHLYKLVHGISVFSSSPITFSHPFHYHTRFNHNLSLHVPFSHSNAYCLTHCLTLLYLPFCMGALYY